MKKLLRNISLITALSAVTVVIIAGCNQGIPGGAGKIDSSLTKSQVIQADDTFNLSTPMLPTSIKQGERIESSIGVKRGKSFDSDIKVKFGELPTGIRIEPSSPTIKHGDEDVKVAIIARSDASLGDFTVDVTGHPEKGADALISFKLTVAKK